MLKHKLKLITKDSWVRTVAANPLYEQSRKLARFMILAAAHQAEPSINSPGTWTRDDLKPSPHTNDFLNYKTWEGQHYATVEHVAPSNMPKLGWDKNLYSNKWNTDVVSRRSKNIASLCWDIVWPWLN